jgi:hypothetical protein
VIGGRLVSVFRERRAKIVDRGAVRPLDLHREGEQRATARRVVLVCGFTVIAAFAFRQRGCVQLVGAVDRSSVDQAYGDVRSPIDVAAIVGLRQGEAGAV